MRFACWIGYRHTLRLCNTYCLSTAAVVSQPRLNVTLFLHRLSYVCIKYNAEVKINRGNLRSNCYAYIPICNRAAKFIRAYSLAISVCETLELFHSIAYVWSQCYNS